MPVTVKKVGSRWKVVEKSTGRVSQHSGSFASKAQAMKQAQAINISKARKKGHKIPRKK
jgi:hypothetical protein